MTALLDILPNPVLVKNQDLEYVWINRAFETLFSVSRDDVIGKLDKDLFPNRQVSQCNGGDLRVLVSGDVDDATETVFEKSGVARETITRKSRLTISDTEVYLIGIMHDITDITHANLALTESQKTLEKQAAELAILATTDAMTGCANRRQLAECDKDIMQNTEHSASILAIDIDKSKLINDNHGHDCGDTVLRHFCDLTRTTLEPNDHFIRLGGEEFAIVMVDTSYDEVKAKADALCKLVAGTPLISKGEALKYTVSIGVATKEKGKSINIDDMLREADENLYKAKNGGRNQVVMCRSLDQF